MFFAVNRYVHSMYLALLAGGETIKRIVKKTLCLPGDEGLEIFDFKGTERTQLQEQLQTTIDSLPLTRTTKEAIIAENIQCFRMNIQIVKGIRINWNYYQKLVILVATAVVILAVAFWYSYVVFVENV